LNRRGWIALVLFVLILVVGLTAGTIDRSAARRWSHRLAGPDLDQRLEALARLARLDHLALIARRPLLNALDDDRLPSGIASGPMLAALIPAVVSGRPVDLSSYSIAGRAARILLVVIPLDYAGFYAELKRQRASVRQRAAGVLGSLGALKPDKSVGPISVLEKLIGDPVPDVRQASVDALWTIWRRMVGHGVHGPPNHACRTAFIEALVSLDPVIMTSAFRFFRSYGRPPQFVMEAFFQAWSSWLNRSTRR
jgi:hypothetical protein